MNKKVLITQWEMNINEWDFWEDRYNPNKRFKSKRAVIRKALDELKDILDAREKRKKQYERRKARKQKEGL